MKPGPRKTTARTESGLTRGVSSARTRTYPHQIRERIAARCKLGIVAIMDFRSIVEKRLRECGFKTADLVWRLQGVVPGRSIYAFLEGQAINSTYLARIFDAL